MTFDEAKSILTRNGFSVDLVDSYEDETRVYVASWEVFSVANATSRGIPRAEVSYNKKLRVTARAGNLPIE